MPHISIVVYGIPQPKGSMDAIGKGRMIPNGTKRSIRKDGTINEGSRARKAAWVKAIIATAKETMAESTFPWPLTCDLRLDTIYYFPIPKSRMTGKNRLIPGQRHAQKPDRSKLDRQIEDPLVVAGMLKDDCLNAEGYSRKEWCLEGEQRAEIVITWL